MFTFISTGLIFLIIVGLAILIEYLVTKLDDLGL